MITRIDDFPRLPGRNAGIHPRPRRGRRQRSTASAISRRPRCRRLVRRSLRDYLQVRVAVGCAAVLPELRRWLGGHHARSDRMPVGTGHAAGGGVARGLGRAGHVGGEDCAVPRQGSDEARAGRRRHSHAAPCGLPHGNECRAAAERIGYPIIVKPIAGAGSADTYRLNSAAELEDALPKLTHVGRSQRRGVRRRRGVHVRYRDHRRPNRLLQRRLVPAAAADRAQQ